MKSEYLSKSNLGILLSNEVISSVFDKKQQLIINASMYKSIINRPIYVINDDKCYGVIELSTPSKITIDEFDSLEDKHNISKEQKNKWWPNKQILFSYKIINVVSKFDKPKLIKQGYKTSYNFVVNSFEFKEGSLFSKNELSECYRLLESIKKEDAQIIKIPKCEAELNYSFVTFENIYEAVEHMFVNGSSFIVEQEYSGVDCTLIKSNDNCYLYSYKKRDISSLFPQIIEQGKIMSGRDYALDCRISIKSKSNEEVKQLIDTDTIYNESDVQLHVIDCLVYDADVRDLEYRDRKQILQGMSYSKNIYETPFLYVEDCNETVHGYNIMNMSDNNVIIKSNNKTNAYIINQELSESSIGNHSFFATQSGPMMYYVGFLSCDGYVDNKTNRIEIHISKEDGEIIRNFQKLIKDNRKITNGFLKFKSVEMVKDLAKYGMDVLKPKRRTFDRTR